MPELRAAYLVHGDDHGAVAERRARLRALAEAEHGAGSVELLDGDAATPAAVAGALAAMTLALGRRVIIVEGVERWREAEVAEHLVPALAQMPPDTTLALFAREEPPRAKAPAALHAAVEKAGGQVVEQGTVKPWELPGWAREQAARLGIALDTAAAKALVAQVGERQQRLLRELEKLALEQDAGAGAPLAIGVADIERRAAHSSERRAYGLADALVGGDRGEALRSFVRLRAQGERPAGLLYVMASRMREAAGVAARLRAGESAAEVKRSLRMPARAAQRFVADVAARDPQQLREGLGTLADLELDSRGGAPIPASRTSLVGLDEDTVVVRSIEAITR
jgi:DNA polymerase-3 subunit delta